jgi:GT2 family glycosyltransferase
METNNAGIVGPIYLWNVDKIHMFGGDITINNNNFMEKHYLVNESINIVNKLLPRKCDYAEYHCLMIRTNLLKKGVLDPSLLIIHEHIDLSLAVKKLGYNTYVTPYSRITYVNNTQLEEYEYSLFAERWNPNIVENDIKYFCKKWGFNYNNSFDNVRNFIKNHIKLIDKKTK